MKALIQTTKPHYKHFLLLCLLFFSLPICTTHATSVKQEPHKTQKTNINNDLDDQKEPGETSIEGIDTERNNTTLQDLDEPIIEGIKQEKKQDNPSFNFKKLKDLISTAIEEVEKSATKLQKNEMVYFYGNTGSGKSTIINYLFCNELEKYYPDDKQNLHTNKKHVDDYMNTNTQSDSDSDDFTCGVQSKQKEKIFRIRRKDPNAIGPIIGRNPIDSETTYPCPYFPKNQPLGFCDTAGFSDTKGIENIVCSYIGNNLIIQKSNKLKAICFLTYKTALETKKGQPFLDSVISTISNMIKETKDCNPLDSIFIVLNNKSQINNAQLVEEVFDMLKDFRKGFKEKKKTDLQNTTKYENYIKILKKILVDSSNKETMRILAITPLDKGQSRKAFLKRISKSPIIPKQNLKKLASKQGEEKVKYLQEKVVQQTEPILDHIITLQQQIKEKQQKASELTIQIQNLNKEEQNLNKTIKDLKSQSQQIQKEQQKLHQEIITKKKEQSELKKKIALKKETEKLFSRYDHVINNKKERISKLEKKQNEVKAKMKKFEDKIRHINDEIDKRTLQIKEETKQIQQLNHQKNILLQNTTQDMILALAKDDKNWFDYYQKLLNLISNHWANTKHEKKVFDSLRKNIYNALNACNPAFIALTGHASNVYSVHFNSSGTLLASSASGFWDRTIKIWDTSTWQCKKTLKGHANYVNSHPNYFTSVHFNPLGTLLASGSGDKTIKIWDTSNWECIEILQEHAGVVYSVHFNSSGTLLASGSTDHTVKIWDTSIWKCKKTLKGHANYVNSVHFNPQGTLLVSGSGDKTIKIWDISTWKCKKTLKGHANYVNSVHFNPQGTLLVSGSSDKTIKIWDTSTWQCIKTLEGHSGSLTSVHFNPSGTLIASGTVNHTVKIWDTSTWQCKKTLKGPNYVNPYSNYCTSVHFNPSGTLLVTSTSGFWNNPIKIWDVKNMLDSRKSSYSLLDKDKFTLQTDTHLKKMKTIIKHYYDTKNQELTNSESQKEAKKLKDTIILFTKKFFIEKDMELTIQKQIHKIHSEMNTFYTKKIEEEIKNKQTNHEIQQELAELIQKKKDVDSIIKQLKQSNIEKQEDLNNISQQIFQAETKRDFLLEKMKIIQGNQEDVSRELTTEEQDLKEYQGILERKQPEIDLILKIDSIVPMGLIAYSFIQKYMQCKVNNKHM